MIDKPVRTTELARFDKVHPGHAARASAAFTGRSSSRRPLNERRARAGTMRSCATPWPANGRRALVWRPYDK
jgi:hypothetical protein